MLTEYYLTIVSASYSETSAFWIANESKWRQLADYAKFILTIPATSALVERVFSAR